MKNMKMISRFFALLLLAVFFVTGCQTLDESGIYSDPSSDAAIAADANTRLNDDSMTARATLGVSVRNGVATLSGMVPNETTRLRAKSIVSGVNGVTSVVDRTTTR